MPDIFQKNLQNKIKDNKDIFDKWKDASPTEMKTTFDVYDVDMAGIADRALGDKVKMLVDYKVIRKDMSNATIEISNAVNMDAAIL